MTDLARWLRAWGDLGAAGDLARRVALRDELLAARSEPHRHYHTVQHLQE
ncbi:MAG: hypothetical protein AB7O97_17375 [Planctomycetota bacterium]